MAALRTRARGDDVLPGAAGGEPVATWFMVLGAGVAGVHGVGTLPQARRQGIGAAMAMAPLREARAMGFRVAVLRASTLGAGIYRRLGFRQCGEISIYAWWPPAGDGLSGCAGPSVRSRVSKTHRAPQGTQPLVPAAPRRRPRRSAAQRGQCGNLAYWRQTFYAKLRLTLAAFGGIL